MGQSAAIKQVPQFEGYTPKAQSVLKEQLRAITSSATAQDIRSLEQEVRRIRMEKEEVPEKSIDEHLAFREKHAEVKVKERELKKESKNILEKAWAKIKGAFKYVYEKVKDGVTWIWEKMKESPILTIIILLLATGVWYYAGGIAEGYSIIPEEGAKIVRETARKTMGSGSIGLVGEINKDLIL